MVLQRDIAVVVVTLAIAAAFYVLSFRDLVGAYPAGIGPVSGSPPPLLHSDLDAAPPLAG